MNSANDVVSKVAITGVCDIFRADFGGKTTLELSRLISQTIKDKKYVTRPEVIVPMGVTNISDA